MVGSLQPFKVGTISGWDLCLDAFSLKLLTRSTAMGWLELKEITRVWAGGRGVLQVSEEGSEQPEWLEMDFWAVWKGENHLRGDHCISSSRTLTSELHIHRGGFWEPSREMQLDHWSHDTWISAAAARETRLEVHVPVVDLGFVKP